MSEARYWTVDSGDIVYSDEDEAVQGHLELLDDLLDTPLPACITLRCHRPKTLTADEVAERLNRRIDGMWDDLAETYGGENGNPDWELSNPDWTMPERISAAINEMASAISDEYPVLALVREPDSDYEVNVSEWAQGSRAEWLSEDASLLDDMQSPPLPCDHVGDGGEEADDGRPPQACADPRPAVATEEQA